MIKKKLSGILIVLLFIMSGCNHSLRNESEYINETDYPIIFQSNLAGNYITASEKGYYFLDGCFLYFADKQTMQADTVCNRPGCKHEYETDEYEVWKCNAFVGAGPISYIQYYQGELYTIQEINPANGNPDRYVVKISLDGTYREKICKLNNVEQFILHRNYIYKYNQEKVMRKKLEEGDEKWEVIFESDMYAVGSIVITAYGDYLYISVYGAAREESMLMAKRLYVYDLMNQKCNKIFTNKEDEGFFIELQPAKAPYLLFRREQPELYLKDPEVYCIYKANLDGTNESLFYNYEQELLEFSARVGFDGQYYFEDQINIVLDESKQKNRVFNVRNIDYEIIATCPMDWLPSWYNRCVGDDDYRFIRWQEADEEGEIHTYTYFMPKEGLQNGNCEYFLLQESTNSVVRPGIMTRSFSD